MYHAYISQKKIRVAILISDKVDLRAKKITRDKEIYNDKSCDWPRR